MTLNPSSQPSANPITYARLRDVLARLRLGVSASDLHGSLVGFLCAGGLTDSHHWLQSLEIDVPAAANSDDTLEQVFDDSSASLNDTDLRFEPLLPDADATIDARADALVDWCRGFLGGLGLAGGSRAGVSDDASEILRDLGTIAGSRFEYENAEEDESALAEVIEFVRVGVLLLHTELGPSKRGGVTLH